MISGSGGNFSNLFDKPFMGRFPASNFPTNPETPSQPLGATPLILPLKFEPSRQAGDTQMRLIIHVPTMRQ